MADSSLATVRLAQRAGLFTALTALGALVSIPLPFSPVPIILNNLFVLLAGLVLPPRWAFLSMVAYLLAGALGLPLFSGGGGGMAHLLGPTGGFLIGFALAAPAVALLSGNRRNVAAMMPAVVVGVGAIYLCGIPWLAYTTGLDLGRALAVAFLPFLPGDLIKAALAVAIAGRIPA